MILYVTHADYSVLVDSLNLHVGFGSTQPGFRFKDLAALKEEVRESKSHTGCVHSWRTNRSLPPSKLKARQTTSLGFVV